MREYLSFAKYHKKSTQMIKGLFIWRWGTPDSIRSIFNLELNVKPFSVAVVLLLLLLLSLLLCCCLC